MHLPCRRGWAAGSVQALNEEDPSDPTGQTVLAYVVKIDPPDSRLVSVPKDTTDYVRAEVCSCHTLELYAGACVCVEYVLVHALWTSTSGLAPAV